jgi:hypothetical protein
MSNARSQSPRQLSPLTFPPISNAATTAMGRQPLFLPDDDSSSPLLRPFKLPHKFPADSQVGREIAIFEQKERDADEAFLQHTRQAHAEAKAQVEEALSSRNPQTPSKKRKASTSETRDEDSSANAANVSMKVLEEFVKLMRGDKRGTQQERLNWPGAMVLVSRCF